MSMEIIDKGFTGAGTDIAKQLIDLNRKTLLKAALIVEADAVVNAPYKTGTLREGITHEVFNEYAIVGTNIEYAPPQEYLYTPHMRPALDNNRNRITKMFKDELKKVK